jgi:membrane-bound lytic murein transglycosylase D
MRFWLPVLAGFLLSCAAVAQDTLFPRPAGLEPEIDFWRRVYTEIDTSSGFVHDSRHLGVVYRTLSFPDDATRRQRNRTLRAVYDELRGVLERLASGRRENLSAEEQRVLALWPDDVSNEELRSAAGRLRFQLGQSNRFRSGLVRAGTWRSHIEDVLERQGLPPELVALPHVESSFDPTAYSKVGAAGMWQFTRSTGLRYMRIDHIVDERRDPFLSTVAAARLLDNNYSVLESWPLALTAYNHGVAGMRRAKRQQDTDDIETIVRNYKGRTFGFASRNFYVAFLAALDIDRDPERYFGSVSPSPAANTLTVELPDFVTIDALEGALDIDRGRLRYWNPALMEPVWSGDKFVPRGFALRLPSALAEDIDMRLAALPATARYTAQMPDIYHRVGRGDTISQIADRYNVSMSSLVELNGLRSRNFIRAGQVLRLPGNGDATPMTLAQLENGVADSDDTNTYIVRAGDNIDAIARRFGVDERVILARNGIRDRNRIFVGQKLQIGGAETVAAVPAVATVSESASPVAEPEMTPAVVVTENIVEAAASRAASSPAEELRLLATEARLAMLTETSIETGVDSPSGTEGMLAKEATLAAGADETAPEANALASEQAELAGDPSDYLVAADGTIEVQALETLGHYADWLGIRTQRLRDINGLPFDKAVVIGERLKLEFADVDARSFEQRRIAYQQDTQEAFFLAYQITDTFDHVIRPGESLWVLALRRYRVPVWLVRQFNPDLDLDQIRPGTVVKFPELRAIAVAESPTQAAN